jgi:hypothetical protein
LRFTCVVACNAAGETLPPAFIIYTTVTSDDQSSQLAIRNLYLNKAFNTDGRWMAATWARELVVKRDKKLVRVLFKRPFLYHQDDFRVVWAQPKAYMDTAGVAMYFDTVLSPYLKRVGGSEAVVVWDNHSSHMAPCVAGVASSLGFRLAALPPNMTDKLQPVDVGLNAPLKAAIRYNRALELYGYQQNWAALADDAMKQQQKITSYAPPLPTIATCIAVTSSVFKEQFSRPAFRDSLQRVFENVGLAPRGDGSFREYKSHEDDVGKRNKTLFKGLGPEYYTREPPRHTFSGAKLFDDVAGSRHPYASDFGDARAEEAGKPPERGLHSVDEEQELGDDAEGEFGIVVVNDLNFAASQTGASTAAADAPPAKDAPLPPSASCPPAMECDTQAL